MPDVMSLFPWWANVFSNVWPTRGSHWVCPSGLLWNVYVCFLVVSLISVCSVPSYPAPEGVELWSFDRVVVCSVRLLAVGPRSVAHSRAFTP